MNNKYLLKSMKMLNKTNKKNNFQTIEKKGNESFSMFSEKGQISRHMPMVVCSDQPNNGRINFL